jgi:hypothetical protein
VAVEPARAGELAAALDAARVPARRLGTAGGRSVVLALGGAEMDVEVDTLAEAWRPGF